MSTPLFGNVIEDNDQTRARREHLERIRELVGNAYPNKFSRTNIVENLERERKAPVTSIEGEDTITSIVGEFQKHVPQLKEGERPTPEQLEASNAELGE